MSQIIQKLDQQQSHKDDILDILSAYPTYFSERVQWICKD